MKKRILSMILALCLGVTTLSGTVFAVETEEPARGVLQYSVAIDPQYQEAQPFAEGLAAEEG